MAKNKEFFIPEDKTRVNNAIWLAIFALITSLIATTYMVVAYFYMKSWNLRRENVVCVPIEQEFQTPMVYRQSAVHPVQTDTVIKNFVAQYVHLTHDEALFEYTPVSNSSVSMEARISQNKWAAVHMSVGTEQKKQKEAFYKSSEMATILKKSNIGWAFLIDDMIINTTPDGSYYVTVRGQYQTTYDPKRSRLPPSLDGYREINFYIVLGQPSEDSNKELVNKYGLYIAFSNERIITPIEANMLANRDKKYYLKGLQE